MAAVKMSHSWDAAATTHNSNNCSDAPWLRRDSASVAAASGVAGHHGLEACVLMEM